MTAGTEENPGEAQARRLETVAEQLKTLLHRPDVAPHMRADPGDNEWSAMQILGHMVEMIPYWMNHCHAMIAAGGGSHHFGRSLDAPERLAGVELGAAGNPDEILRVLNGELQAAATTIRRVSAADRDKKGVYSKGGEMTVAEVIERLIVAHAEAHLAQVRATLRAYLYRS